MSVVFVLETISAVVLQNPPNSKSQHKRRLRMDGLETTLENTRKTPMKWSRLFERLDIFMNKDLVQNN